MSQNEKPQTSKQDAPEKAKPRRKPVLRDHQQRGKTFVPPLLAILGDTFRGVSWRDQLVPELLWLQLLIDRLDLKKGVCLGQTFTKAITSQCSEQPSPVIRISDYTGLAQQSWDAVLSALSERELSDLRRSLWPLVGLYPACPLSGVFDSAWRAENRCDPDVEIPYLKRVLSDISDKRDQKAAVLQATAIYLWGVSGRFHVMEGVELPDLNEFVRNPSGAESQKTASWLRATVNVLASDMFPSAGDWVSYFWEQGLRISACDTPRLQTVQDAAQRELARVARIGREFREALSHELQEAWSTSLEAIHRHGTRKAEVLCGLLSRQSSLASALASYPAMWTTDVAYIVLRCMAETHIALAWLAKFGKEEHFDTIVEYGLGQDKLLAEHLKAQGADDYSDAKALAQRVEAEIDREKYTALLQVNVGQWWPKSVREMAEECDCLELFALWYQPFAGFVHGTWNTLKRCNLVQCQNPLHNFHMIPAFCHSFMQPLAATRAVTLMADTFQAWSEGLGLPHTEVRCCDSYFAALEAEEPDTEDE